MFDSVINKLTNFFQQTLIEFKTENNIAQDDPFFQTTQTDISFKIYKQLTENTVTFLDQSNGLRYTDWLPPPFIQDFHDVEAFPLNENGEYQAKEISIMYRYGLVVVGEDRWFCYIPPLWEGAKNIMPNNFCLKGEEAALFWNKYWQLLVDLEAEILALGIKNAPRLLTYIQNEKPYLRDNPIINEQILNAFWLNKKTHQNSIAGQKPEIKQNIFDLYHWVYWYRYQGLSLEKSCMYAVDYQSNLVPDNWTNPYETLKKRVTRLDKFPRISQLKGLRDKLTP